MLNPSSLPPMQLTDTGNLRREWFMSLTFGELLRYPFTPQHLYAVLPWIAGDNDTRDLLKQVARQALTRQSAAPFLGNFYAEHLQDRIRIYEMADAQDHLHKFCEEVRTLLAPTNTPEGVESTYERMAPLDTLLGFIAPGNGFATEHLEQLEQDLCDWLSDHPHYHPDNDEAEETTPAQLETVASIV